MKINVKQFGFTLAEVLITLVIIGIVAALTIPPVIENYKTKSWNTSATNFERKLGEALKIMDSQNILQGYSSTKDFVNELQKHFKILKVCDTVTDCFTDKIKLQNGKILDVSTLTNSEKLGHYEFGTDTVGIQFANGVSAILAYNPGMSEKIADYNDIIDGKFHGIKLKTDVVSVLYDVSGQEIPNTVSYDIKSINTKLQLTADDCKQVGDYCILDIGTDYSAFDCSATAQRNGAKGFTQYCGSPSGFTEDYWAGAKKACNETGLKLPDTDDLDKIYAMKGMAGIPASGIFWASSQLAGNSAYTKNFSGTTSYTTAKSTELNVMCIK